MHLAHTSGPFFQRSSVWRVSRPRVARSGSRVGVNRPGTLASSGPAWGTMHNVQTFVMPTNLNSRRQSELSGVGVFLMFTNVHQMSQATVLSTQICQQRTGLIPFCHPARTQLYWAQRRVWGASRREANRRPFTRTKFTEIESANAGAGTLEVLVWCRA